MLSCLGDKFLHSATAFRSLEAYNEMISGFIASVQGHIIADKFVVLARNPGRFVLAPFRTQPVRTQPRSCRAEPSEIFS